MYARKYGDDNTQQSFRRGEYTIPANYAGNAFTADEIPDLSYTKSEAPPDEAAKNTCDVICEEKNEITDAPQPLCCEDAMCQKEPCKQNCPCLKESEQCTDANKEEPRRGIFRDLLGRFDRGFELDDLLLIGLIILLLNSDKDECESSRDEIIILLAFLLLSGF
ncbi:MAG: hypothetical protein IJY93_02940 [Clostridia bacterium]|nr:hypothetical protein [Clostridia bacterium]